MIAKTIYKIRFAFYTKINKDSEIKTKTIIRNIVAPNVDSAIENGKNHIMFNYSEKYYIFNYIGCAVLSKEKVYIVE